MQQVLPALKTSNRMAFAGCRLNSLINIGSAQTSYPLNWVGAKVGPGSSRDLGARRTVPTQHRVIKAGEASLTQAESKYKRESSTNHCQIHSLCAWAVPQSCILFNPRLVILGES